MSTTRVRRGGLLDRRYRLAADATNARGTGLLGTLVGQDTLHGAPGQAIDYDWTQLGVPGASYVLPARRARVATLSYEEIQPASVTGTLLGQDAFHGGPGQTPTPDWTQQGVPVAAHRVLARARLLGALVAFQSLPKERLGIALRIALRPLVVDAFRAVEMPLS